MVLGGTLLPEVSFYCNNLENGASGIAPHLLAFGRQPLAPLDARIARNKLGGTTSEEGYVEELIKKKEELNAIAKRNQELQRAKVKDYYDQGKEVSDVAAGAQILLKREQRKSALEPKFDGPFRVIQRRGPILEAERSNKRQWIHIHRCKKYESGARLSIPPMVGGSSCSTEEGPDIASGSEVEEQAPDDEEPGYDEVEPETALQEGSNTPLRRYPQRSRNPKKFYLDPVPWSKVPKSVLYPRPPP